ncbi:hypothetical protein [Micromonospora globbae]|uniref:Uncharacterized protein n=1 Tax=Micromonospora globbae TaxID=1894969 RepID=A0ABZ1SG63_9ACTN|nr:hypothetical protein [Micromonospora globbae]
MKTVRGKRPVYLGDTHTDRLLAAIVVLTQEIGVLQRRVAALEAATGIEGEGAGSTSIAMSRLVDELTARTDPASTTPQEGTS